MAEKQRALLPSMLNIWLAAALLALVIWRINTADMLREGEWITALAACVLELLLILFAGQALQLFSYRCGGWRMRAMMLGGVGLVRLQGKLRLRVCGLSAGRGVLMLGMSVPETPDVASQEEFDQAREVLAKACMAQAYGVNAAAVLLYAAGFGLSFILPKYAAYLLACAAAAVCVAAIYNWGAQRQSMQSIGCAAAAALVREDDFFAAYCLYDLLQLQENGTPRREQNKFLRDRLAQTLGRIPPQQAGRIALEAWDLLLMEHLAGGAPEPTPASDYYMEYFAQDYQVLRREKSAEIYPILFLHLAYALKQKGDDRWKIMEVHMRSALSRMPGKKVQAYYRLQTQQIIYHEDHHAHLAKKENIHNCAAWRLYALFDCAFDNELALNAK